MEAAGKGGWFYQSLLGRRFGGFSPLKEINPCGIL
jgi:hypothetical protein